jgi:hypothetical protein
VIASVLCDSGHLRHQPPLLYMSSLDDPEDDFPTREPMPNDTDRETAETIAPDTDRAERDTSPPGADDAEATRAAATMLPAAPSAPAPAPPEYWKAAYDKLVEIHEDQRKDREGRAARDDALVLRLSAAAREASDANVADLKAAMSEVVYSVESIGNRLITLEESDAQQTKRLAEGEKRFDDIERQLADLKGLVTKLEADLKEAKANVPARPAPSPGQ